MPECLTDELVTNVFLDSVKKAAELQKLMLRPSRTLFAGLERQMSEISGREIKLPIPDENTEAPNGGDAQT